MEIRLPGKIKKTKINKENEISYLAIYYGIDHFLSDLPIKKTITLRLNRG